jgi:transcriptional regulator of aromatic amino acid metabolism
MPLNEVSLMRPSAMTGTISARQFETEDEFLATLYRLPLLITAKCVGAVTTVARRIHAHASEPGGPLITFPAADLPGRRAQFAEQWSWLMLAGCGGSLLITGVEEMPGPAQFLFLDSLDRLRETRSPLAARLITGTTVSLLNRVEAGRFSEDLLYRLNVMHLHRHEPCAPCSECAARSRAAQKVSTT